MRKNVLLSLIAMSSASMAAYANIDLSTLLKSGGSLAGTFDGVAEGKDLWTGTSAGTSAAEIKATTKKLVPGTYTFKAGKMDNATVTVNGKTCDVTNGATFTLTTDQAITIVATATDKTKEFEVGNYELTLVYDFAAAKAQLLFDLSEVTNQIHPDDDVKGSDLYKRASDIAAVIAKLADDKTDSYALYKDNALYKAKLSDCKISKDIEALKEDVVAARANIVAYLNANSVYTTLKESYDAVENKYNVASKYTKDVYESELNAIKTALSGFTAAIEGEKKAVGAALAGSTANDSASFETTWSKRISDLSENIDNADLNNDAKTEIDGQITTAKTAYNTAVQTLITALKDYAITLKEAQAELKVVYVKISDVEAKNTATEAAKNKLENEVALHAAGDSIKDIQKRYTNKATDLKDAYDTAKAAKKTLDANYADINVENVSEKFTTEIKKVEDAIKAFADSIETYNTACTIDTYINSSKYSTLKTTAETAIKDLNAKAAPAVANYDANKNTEAVIKALQDSLDNHTTEIGAIMYGTVSAAGKYNTTKTALQKVVTGYKTAAATANTKGTAVTYWDTNFSKIEATASEIEAYLETAKTALDNYTNVQTAIDGYNESYDAMVEYINANPNVTVGGVIPGKSYQSVLDELKGKIEAVQTTLNTAVSKSGDEHVSKLAAAEASLSGNGIDSYFTTYSEVNYLSDKAIYDKNVTTSAAETMLSQALNTLDKVSIVCPSETELGNSYDDIKDEYEALSYCVDAQKKIVNSYKGSDGHLVAGADAAEALAALSTANVEIGKINEDLATLNEKAGSIKAFVKANNDTATVAYQKVADLRALLVGGEIGSTTYKAVSVLNEDGTKTSYFAGLVIEQTNLIDAQKTAIEKSQKAETLVKDWDDSTDANEMTVKGIESLLNDIETSINALRDEAVAATKNVKAKDAQEKKITDLKVETNIAAALTSATDDASEPAKTHYMALAGSDGYSKELANIKNDITKSYNAGTSVADNKVILARINDLNTEAKALPAAIKANETCHNTQVLKDASVQELWETVYNRIAAYDKSEMADTFYLPQLAVLQTELNTLRANVATNFGEGKSEEYDEETVNKYVAAESAIITLSIAQQDGYSTAIIADNDARYATFRNSAESANDAFVKAVQTINKYNNIENDAYREALGEINETTNKIYTYSTKILNLKSEADSAHSAANKICGATPTSPELYDVEGAYNTQALTYKSEIEKIQADFQTDVDDAVEILFETTLSNAEGALSAALEDIKDYDQKVKAASFADVRDLIDQIKTAQNTAGFALKADSLFEAFENVPALITAGYQTAAYAQWTADLAAANKKIDGYKKNLKIYELTSDDFNAEVAKVDSIKNIAEKYKAEGNLYENLDVVETALDEISVNVKSYYDAAIQANQNSVDNTNAYNEVAASIKITSDSLIYAITYVRRYEALDLNTKITACTTTLSQLDADNKTWYENFTSSAHKDALLGRDAALRTNIGGLIASAFTEESTTLVSAISNLKKEYSTAIAEAPEKQDEITPYNAVIADYEARLAALMSIDDYAKQQAAQDGFLDLEHEIAVTLSKIVAIYGNGNADALAKVNDAIAGLTDDRKTAADYLATCFDEVKTAYTADLKVYADTIEHFTAVKNGYDEAGTLLFFSENLLKQIAANDKAVVSLYQDIKTMQAPLAANAAAYDSLCKVITNYRGELIQLKTTIAGYESTTAKRYRYEESAKAISDLLTTAQETLDVQNGSLTAASTIVGESDITSKLAALKGQAAYNESDYQANDVLEPSISTLHDEINGNTYKAETKAELLAEAETLGTANTALAAFIYAAHYGVISADIDGTPISEESGFRVVSFNDSIDAIFAKITELKAALTDLSGRADSEKFMKGDVNLDGNINVTDYSRLSGHIMGSVEFDDLQCLAADVNGDRDIDISDLTSVGKVIRDGETIRSLAVAKVAACRVAAKAALQDDAVSLTTESLGEAGTRIAIRLIGSSAFVGCQMDIVLPDGATLMGESLGDRAAAHDLATSYLGLGTHRVLVSDMAITEFTEGDALIYLDVKGLDDLTDLKITGIIFADADGAPHRLANVDMTRGTTAIDAIASDATSGGSIYSIGGTMMKALRQGINIVRHADGSTTKVLKK